ncbi:MAG: response regulator [Deltaproteobacteria bacterium]|nr:response regulator [Deltaproteobacteria bacterium]
MASSYRVLATGGDRAVLVGLARALQAAGTTFAASTDPARLVESAAKFAPHLILAFARPSPDEAVRRVRLLRADPRLAQTPIVLVASLPPKGLSGVTEVMPDPSDVGEFAQRLLKLMEAATPTPAGPPPPPEEALEEIAVVEEIQSLPARILLVDDDPSLVKLFSIAMRKSGFEVLVAADGVQGLEVALRSRPDLVVADLNMPRLDGWGLLRAIRADHRLGETPLVFLSAHDDYREGLKALSAGAQDYIAKGGKLEALIARIRMLLSPRDAFLGAMMARERVGTKLEELGIQWALRRAAAVQATGMIVVRDAFWSIQAAMGAGALVWAQARIGRHQLDGEAALPPLVVLRAGELLFDPAAAPPAANVTGDLHELLEAAALKNNQNEAEALDRLLTRATHVEIDEQLYLLYEQLGPPESRQIAALIRQGLTPKEVIATSEFSPMDIEQTVRDLVRRRVLRLSP